MFDVLVVGLCKNMVFPWWAGLSSGLPAPTRGSNLFSTGISAETKEIVSSPLGAVRVDRRGGEVRGFETLSGGSGTLSFVGDRKVDVAEVLYHWKDDLRPSEKTRNSRFGRLIS